MDLAWATPGVIHLEVGQPDFDTPEHIVEAACHYARQGHTRYVPNSGIDEVREARPELRRLNAGGRRDLGDAARERAEHAVRKRTETLATA